MMLVSGPKATKLNLLFLIRKIIKLNVRGRYTKQTTALNICLAFKASIVPLF